MIEIALMALINRARGGLVPSWWDKVTNYLPRNFDYLLAVMAVMLFVQDDMIVAFLFAFGMYLGVMDGWGKQLGSVLDRKEQYNESEGFLNALHYVSNFFINEKQDYLNYSRLWLVLRGFQWFIFPLGFMAYIDVVTILEALTMALMMGVFWVLCVEVARYDFLPPKNSWGLSEWLFGACQGALLLYIF